MTSQFEQLLIEALSDTQKELIDQFKQSAIDKKEKAQREVKHLPGDEPEKIGHEQHDELFYKHTGNANSDRLVSPISSDRSHIPPNPKVMTWLESNGYSTDKYHDKVASRIESTGRGEQRERIYRIGGLLQKSAPSHIRKSFETDPSIGSSKNELQMVVSREKYDIGGMTSGRRWTGQSCMRLPGEDATYPEVLKKSASENGDDYDSYIKGGGYYHQKMKSDFEHGTLTGFFTKKGDDEAQDPIGRVLFKKMVGTKEGSPSHVIFRPEKKVYGNDSTSLRLHAEKFANENWPSKEGFNYEMAHGLYQDSSIGFSHHVDGKHEDEDSISIFKNNKLHSPDNNTPSQEYRSIFNGDHTKVFHQNGLHHRDGDLPSLERKTEDGKLKALAFHKNGLLHRDGDKPASTSINNDGYTHLSYYKYGINHRDGDNPSIISTDKDGKITNKEYHKYGMLHRDNDLPAIETDNGVNSLREWYSHGNMHRDGDQPAQIKKRYTYDKKLETTQLWKKDGEYNREAGKPTKVVSSSNIEGTETVIESHHINKNGFLKNSLGSKFPHTSKESYSPDSSLIEHNYEDENGKEDYYELHSSTNNTIGKESVTTALPGGKNWYKTEHHSDKNFSSINHQTLDEEKFPQSEDRILSYSHTYNIDHDSKIVAHISNTMYSSNKADRKTKEIHSLDSLPNEHRDRIRHILNQGNDHVGFLDGMKKKILGEDK